MINVLGGLLPSVDHARRRRIRAAARELVTLQRWPDDDVVTGDDVAQLALLRVLWLQKQARRAGGSQEAVAVLARLALETALQGVYYLHKEGAVGSLKAANVKAAAALSKHLVDDAVVPQDLLDAALATLGTPGKAPDLFAMSEFIQRKLPASKAVNLYRRYYVSTSTFFVHTNAASLLRHVNWSDELAERPSFPWTRASAIRVTDFSVGFLAEAIARKAGKSAQVFDDYANAHIDRAFVPVAVVTARGVYQALRPSALPRIMRAGRKLRAYTASGQALADSVPVRRDRVRRGLLDVLRECSSLPEKEMAGAVK